MVTRLKAACIVTIYLSCGALLVEGSLQSTVLQPAAWRSCSGNAAFQVNAVGLEPSDVIPPGGQLSILVDGTNTRQVTAGDATVTVWYFGVRVLTASDTLCSAPSTSSARVTPARKLMSINAGQTLGESIPDWQLIKQQQHGTSIAGLTGDVTCTMNPGPLHLTHTANLPGIAPRGRYSMRLAASDMVTGQQILCLDVWFRVG